MTLVTRPRWVALLEALSLRNGQAEVTRVDGQDRDCFEPVYRVRVLEYGGLGVVVERPGAAASSGAVVTAAGIGPGTRLALLIADEEERWELIVRVREATLHALNRSVAVPALRLSAVESARRAQRRAHYRAAVAGLVVEPVRLVPVVDPAAAEAEPRDGVAGRVGAHLPEFPPQPFGATLVNLGGGGLGVEAPQRVAGQLRRVRRYVCQLELPTIAERFDLPARLTHLAPLDGGTHYLGLTFDYADRLVRRACEDRICRFTAWVQRQQLKRMKEKAE